MVKVGKWIARHRILVLLIGVLLIVPSIIGIAKTKVNYDLLSYLPDHLETVKGQDILVDEFGMGAFSMVAVENMDMKDVQKLEKEFEKVPHVQDVLWYDDVADISLPVEMIPKKLREAFFKGDATMMLVLFDNTTSSDDSRCYGYQEHCYAGTADLRCNCYNSQPYCSGAYIRILRSSVFVPVQYRPGNSL